MGEKSEAASKSQKRKRGRPRKVTQADLAFVQTYQPHLTTNRGRANHHYATRAIRILMNDDRFLWLGCHDNVVAAGGTLRFTILQELGRIEDDDELRAVAELICERKPKAKEAAVMIRRYRGVSRDNATSGKLGLMIALERALNTHLQLHPAIARTAILGAIDELRDMAEGVFSEAAS